MQTCYVRLNLRSFRTEMFPRGREWLFGKANGCQTISASKRLILDYIYIKSYFSCYYVIEIINKIDWVCNTSTFIHTQWYILRLSSLFLLIRWLRRLLQCGKKDVSRLPTIIGGGDLVDGLCSQTNSQDDFVRMPAAEPVRPREVIAPQLVPKKTTIKSSVFGGYVWMLWLIHNTQGNLW